MCLPWFEFVFQVSNVGEMLLAVFFKQRIKSELWQPPSPGHPATPTPGHPPGHSATRSPGHPSTHPSPNYFQASFMTSAIQSCRGLPFLRMKRPICGCRVLSTNAFLRRGCPCGLSATLPAPQETIVIFPLYIYIYIYIYIVFL